MMGSVFWFEYSMLYHFSNDGMVSCYLFKSPATEQITPAVTGMDHKEPPVVGNGHCQCGADAGNFGMALRDAPPQIAEAAAFFDMAFQLVDPGLDGLVACLGGQIDLIGDGYALSADGGGVQAIGKRVRRWFGLLSRRRAGRSKSGGGGRGHAAQPLSA